MYATNEGWREIMAAESREAAFRKVNVARHNRGLKPLIWSPVLARSAQTCAKEVERDPGPLKHNARWWLKIYKYAGKRTFGEIGENIGEGQKDSDTIVRMWIASPPHFKVMMDDDITHGAIGHYGDSWCLHTGERI